MRIKKEPYVARKMCATQGSIFSFFLGISEDAKLCLFQGVRRCPDFPKTIGVTRQTEIFSKGQLFVSCPSHNIPIKPYTFPLLFQLQNFLGRGHFSPNFHPIILHENPSIFPASPFLFIPLQSSQGSHFSSSSTRFYEIRRDPLKLLGLSLFLLPTFNLGIGK